MNQARLKGPVTRLFLLLISCALAACGDGGGGGNDGGGNNNGGSGIGGIPELPVFPAMSAEIFSVYHPRLPALGNHEYPLEITGVELDAASGVTVNGAPATILSQADSRLRLSAPAGIGVPGNYDVEVITNSGSLFQSVAYATPLFDISKIDINNDHGCLVQQGRLMCWGRNTYNKTSLPGDVYSPKVSSYYDAEIADNTVTDVAAGNRHTCVILQSGAVECFGYNYYGQLGNGESGTFGNLPVAVTGIDGTAASASAIVAGTKFSCAILTPSNEVQCWGDQTGLVSSTTPVTLAALDGSTTSKSVTAITASADHICALLETGGVTCLGQSSWGVLGDGSIDGTSKTAVAIAASKAFSTSHTCALLDTGAVECWGYNGDGNLGDPVMVTSYSTAPHTVQGIDGSAASAIAISASCAVLTDNSLKCWGHNENGQIGDGTTSFRNAPVTVSGLDGSGRLATRVTSGISNTCVLYDEFETTSAGMCWGWNLFGRNGTGYEGRRTLPTSVTEINGTTNQSVRVDTGSEGGCALLSTGAVQCWGANHAGQLGIGESLSEGGRAASLMPITVNGIDGSSAQAIDIATGYHNACAVLTSGAVQCWGKNYYGEVGQDPEVSTAITEPATLDGMDGSGLKAQQVAIGEYHGCALMANGAVKCWGENTDGELGNPGAGDNSWQPVTVSGIDGSSSGTSALQVEVGEYFSCALMVNGGVKCWGYNSNGRLGNNDTTETTAMTPVDVVGIEHSDASNTATTISTSHGHTCAIMENGTVKCWGYNDSGQIGDGTSGSSDAYFATAVLNISDADPARRISAGNAHTCVTLESGKAQCWGNNGQGALGDGGITDSVTPISVSNFSGSNAFMAGISAGDNLTCGLVSTGALMCWGYDYNGGLGSDYYDSKTPTLELLEEDTGGPLPPPV